MILARRAAIVLALPALLAAAPDPTPVPVGPADLSLVADISDPVFAPDGDAIAYTLTVSDTTEDEQTSDIWIVPWAGGAPRNLTHSADSSEFQPSFQGDGRRIVFLRDGDGKGGTPEDDETVQLWSMAARGGRMRQISHIPGGMSDYSLSRDGTVAIVVAETGGSVGADPDKTAPPIVIDRFAFKEDGRDRLDARRQHLFRIDMATGSATQISAGEQDDLYPAISPDGTMVAFVSKRGPDGDRGATDVFVMAVAGGDARRISDFDGPDADPAWEAGGPQWSPDGTRLVWLRGGETKWIYYAPHRPVTRAIAGGPVTAVPNPERWLFFPRFSADGSEVLGLDEGDRETRLIEIGPDGVPVPLTPEKRFVSSFAVGPEGRIAVLEASDDHLALLRRLDGTVLADHNEWLARRRIAPMQEIAFRDDGQEIHGFLVLPPDHVAGQRHPLIVRLHGGPVYQFSHEFMADWQALAAHGYAVLGINPRGSSGRGFDFARAIYADWGNRDVADIKAGIDHVIAMGVADPARIGIGGWSYGGILTDYMIASDPRIRAAVSGAGMANFLAGYGADQYVQEYEAELGTPWRNLDTYQRLSYPFLHADRITTPTLFLCAGADANVPCIGAEQMYQALRSNGVPSRLVVYPDENHGLSVPSYIVDRMQRTIDWYDRYLGKP